MKISVIVPTYNRLARLRQVIKALENQDIGLDQFEVLVVSDGSDDGTDEYLQMLQTPLQLRPLFQQNQGAAVARNTCCGITHLAASCLNSLIIFFQYSSQKILRASQLVCNPLVIPKIENTTESHIRQLARPQAMTNHSNTFHASNYKLTQNGSIQT